MGFPTFKQHDSVDCGCTCLRIISKYYGRSYPSTFLSNLCNTSKDGVSLLSISDAAEHIGFKTVGVKVSWEQIRKDVPLPCIVYWQQQHFIVVYKIKKNKIYVSDPAFGLTKYGKDSFLKNWISTKDEYSIPLGVALLLEPTERFYTREHCKNGNVLNLHYLTKHLRTYKKSFFRLFAGMLVGCILSMIFPFVSQSIVDIGIGTKNLDFVVIMLIAQVLIVFGQAINDLIRSWIMLKMTMRLSISLISDFLCKLMRLPIAFFDSKNVGDILQRIGDYDRIQSFLAETMLSMVMAIVTFIVYGCIMTGYDIGILVVFLLGSVLYISWIMAFMRWRRKIDHLHFQLASTSQNVLVQMVTGMQEIKMNNCEKQKRLEWERIQERIFKISVKSLTLEQMQFIVGIFIDQTKNVLISFLAAKAVISGSMTLGIMIAIQYIIGQLNAPVSQFITFCFSFQDAKISMERLGEIYNKDSEEPAHISKSGTIPSNADIELRNVSFRYGGKRSKKVLDSISLLIPANKVTAIVGHSGSGKTTLLKLILGFYRPSNGMITINGSPLDKFSKREWRAKCGTVMQEGYIFSDSIANNVSISDETTDNRILHEAAKTANIENFINELPLGYNTKIGIDGNGLSQGQKQRVLIARAVYKNPSFIFLDEATNSLDAKNERTIVENLNEFYKGRTVVVVAHRLSTVKNADQIVVLDGGKVVEIGNHTALIEKKGAYYNLVKNQLELGN